VLLPISTTAFPISCACQTKAIIGCVRSPTIENRYTSNPHDGILVPITEPRNLQVASRRGNYPAVIAYSTQASAKNKV
jgi:hypothetical protein